MKTCPKCGQEVPESDQFCSRCGATLATNETTNPTRQSRRQGNQGSKTPKKRWGRWLALAIGLVLLLVGGGVWFNHAQSQPVTEIASSSSASTSQSSSSESESMTNSSSHVMSNSQSSTQSGKLSTNLGPRESAAVIMYYGAYRLNNRHYQGDYRASLSNQALAISMSNLSKVEGKTGYDDHPGQGMAYSLAPGEVDAYISYTLDKDKTVNFYAIGDQPGDLEYLGSASWNNVINYANQHNVADQIHQLGSYAKIYGTGE